MKYQEWLRKILSRILTAGGGVQRTGHTALGNICLERVLPEISLIWKY